MHKDTFSKVIKNKLLFQQIFSFINHYHNNILQVKIFKWSDLITDKNNKHLLAYYGYIDEIKKIYNNQRNRNNNNNSSRSSSELDQDKKEEIHSKEIVYCIKGNSLEILKYYIEIDPNILTNTFPIHFATYSINKFSLISIAVMYGHWQIIYYLVSLSSDSIKWNYVDAFVSARFANNLKLLQYLYEKFDDPSHLMMEKSNLELVICSAADFGDIDMIKWILSKLKSLDKNQSEVNFSNAIIKGATIGGHFNIIKYYFENKPIMASNLNIQLAIKYNRLDILKFFFKKNKRKISMSDTTVIAAKCGYLEILEWLLENHTNASLNNLMDHAAGHGHLEIVKFLHFNRTEGCTTDAMDRAGMNGHIEVVKWLHENRTEGCTVNIIEHSSSLGHIEIVKWLHENRTEGCTPRAMDDAARNGHLEIVKFLHQNRTEGCTVDAMDNAATNGHLEVVKFLHHNRTEGCTVDAMNGATQYNQMDVVKFLHENRTEGCTIDAMNSCVVYENFEMLKWLHENRTEGCNETAMNNAASNGNIEILKWLHFNRSEGCTTDAMDFQLDNQYEIITRIEQKAVQLTHLIMLQRKII